MVEKKTAHKKKTMENFNDLCSGTENNGLINTINNEYIESFLLWAFDYLYSLFPIFYG